MAWALSDKEDVDTLQCLWALMKRRYPDAKITTLMTDDGIRDFPELLYNCLQLADLAGVLACVNASTLVFAICFVDGMWIGTGALHA